MYTEDIVMYLIFGGMGLIFAVIIIYYFTRWVFSIKRQLWNQKQQIVILIGIAEKLGVNTNNNEFGAIKRANKDEIDIW